MPLIGTQQNLDHALFIGESIFTSKGCLELMKDQIAKHHPSKIKEVGHFDEKGNPGVARHHIED